MRACRPSIGISLGHNAPCEGISWQGWYNWTHAKARHRDHQQAGLAREGVGQLTQTATRFKCEVNLERNGRRVSAKSIMGVMMLAAGKGVTIQIETDGEDRPTPCAIWSR